MSFLPLSMLRVLARIKDAFARANALCQQEDFILNRNSNEIVALITAY